MPFEIIYSKLYIDLNKGYIIIIVTIYTYKIPRNQEEQQGKYQYENVTFIIEQLFT